MNIQDIKQNYRIEDVIGKSVHLKRQGPELAGNCIFHDDTHASMKINPVKQIFKCFACGAGGDMVDFFTKQGHSIDEAKKMIIDGTIIATSTPTEKTSDITWEDIPSPQQNLPNVAQLNFKDYGNPSNFWAYTDRFGNINGYVLRFDLPEGKKDVIPYTYKKRTENNVSKTGWFWRGFEVKRPLYNLHELHNRPNAIVLVVEGEKTADAAKILFPQYVVTTWIGGGENVKNADLSPLTGRNIYLWPDNDLPGIHCMFGGWSKNEKTGIYRRIMGLCELISANFKWIRNSKDFPKKWDVADATWSPDEALQYLKANRMEIPAVSSHAPNEKPQQLAPPEPIKQPVVISEKPKLSRSDETPKNAYFKCLGFENNDQNLYVFFVYRTNVIIKLSASGINTANLLQLAPLNFWEGNFPKNTKTGGVKFEINTVADTLISACSKMGIFNKNKIRGRGAWIDNSIPVMHCGDTLIVDGKYLNFSDHKSKFIYEAGQELSFEIREPMKKVEAYKLINILERLNWAREVDARLLAGWIVIAPMCGALNWRPHLWLTGASGSGKTWIMNSPVKHLLGNMFVDAQSETTEAGIRQFLKNDALPVIFDEAESEDKRAAERMQSVLNIMRASSSSDGGKIIKGAAGGTAVQFDIRSCFAFASIGANLTQRSDISRITVLEIKHDISPDKKERWTETQKMFSEIYNDDYVQSFQSRSLLMLPTILQNSKTFSSAAAAELDNQRAGDQLGALLAGAYSLTSDKLISFEDATKWIKERDWSEERAADSTRDEVKVINRIMDAETSVETTGYGNKVRTIGELIIIGRNEAPEYEEYIINDDQAKIWLKRLGIKIEGEFIIVSDNSEFIRRTLVNTAYAKNYHTILSRVNGAEKVESTRFGSHVRSKATKIPFVEIFGENIKSEKPDLAVPHKKTYSKEK